MAATKTTSATSRKPAAKRAAAAGKTTRSRRTTGQAGSTRTRTQPQKAARDTQTAARSTANVVGDYAERAVLIPVGAALIARERVLESVGEAISSYSSPSKAQVQLRRFERRGATARNRLEREVRKTRTRFERELRQRRRELDRQRGHLVKSFSNQVEQIEKTQSQLEETVQARLKDGAELANKVGERVLSLV
jgi:hypothetical protein